MKTLVSLLVALCLCAGLCSTVFAEGKTIKIGATPVPHAEILELIKDDMAEKGFPLEIVIYTDYPLVNPAVADGSLDDEHVDWAPVEVYAQYIPLETAAESARPELTGLTRCPSATVMLRGMALESAGVRLLCDDDLRPLPALAFHPLTNEASLTMSTADFFGKFLPAARHDVTFLPISGPEA